jgi:hypothetical protein
MQKFLHVLLCYWNIPELDDVIEEIQSVMTIYLYVIETFASRVVIDTSGTSIFRAFAFIFCVFVR